MNHKNTSASLPSESIESLACSLGLEARLQQIPPSELCRWESLLISPTTSVEELDFALGAFKRGFSDSPTGHATPGNPCNYVLNLIQTFGFRFGYDGDTGDCYQDKAFCAFVSKFSQSINPELLRRLETAWGRGFEKAFMF